jgi:hypothetical protein
MEKNMAHENNGQKAKSLADSALAKLAEALERGESAELKRYLEVMGRFHNYSFGNTMLIASQRPDATMVAGFHKWHEFGRFVMKGQKGIAILAPIVTRAKADDTDDRDDSGKPPRRCVGFRVVYVFDVTQTDGEPMPDSGIRAAAGEPGEHLEALSAFAGQSKITVAYSADLHGAKGMSEGGKITLLTGMTAAETFLVMAHEIAHELLHRGERRAKINKTVRETEAEAVAFVVASAIGLESDGSVDYIRLYDGDRETLAESLTFVQQAASAILAGILEPAAAEVVA